METRVTVQEHSAGHKCELDMGRALREASWGDPSLKRC